VRERRRFTDGGEWESAYGYCRAIRTDDLILVSGCTSALDGTVRHPADPAAQTRVAIETALGPSRPSAGAWQTSSAPGCTSRTGGTATP